MDILTSLEMALLQALFTNYTLQPHELVEILLEFVNEPHPKSPLCQFLSKNF